MIAAYDEEDDVRFEAAARELLQTIRKARSRLSCEDVRRTSRNA